MWPHLCSQAGGPNDIFLSSKNKGITESLSCWKLNSMSPVAQELPYPMSLTPVNGTRNQRREGTTLINIHYTTSPSHDIPKADSWKLIEWMSWETSKSSTSYFYALVSISSTTILAQSLAFCKYSMNGLLPLVLYQSFYSTHYSSNNFSKLESESLCFLLAGPSTIPPDP